MLAIWAAKREDDPARFALQIDSLCNAITLRAAMDPQRFERFVHAV